MAAVVYKYCDPTTDFHSVTKVDPVTAVWAGHLFICCQHKVFLFGLFRLADPFNAFYSGFQGLWPELLGRYIAQLLTFWIVSPKFWVVSPNFYIHISNLRNMQVDNWAATWDEMFNNYKMVDAEPYC